MAIGRAIIVTLATKHANFKAQQFMTMRRQVGSRSICPSSTFRPDELSYSLEATLLLQPGVNSWSPHASGSKP